MAASYSPATVQQSQSGCLFFDIAPPRAFSFDQKLYTKRCANNSSHDKTISFLLELIDQVLSISEYVLEKH